jgi:hypothetical protein
MRTFNDQWLKAGVAKAMHHSALRGSFSLAEQNLQSRANMDYLESCRAHHQPTGTRIIFTRDSGHHTSGWWKNPDYERCLHLSLSFQDPDREDAVSIEHRHDLASEWVEIFFPTSAHLVWTEPPHGPEGKRADVWHYRVFYTPGWTAPILPRGEVYTKEFTAAGWLSWSDRAAQLAAAKEDAP